MAELLIRTVDKINHDSRRKNAACTKRGDVIVIVEDGWPWSQTERNNPEWIIKKFPGIRAAKLSGFLAQEPVPLDARGLATDEYIQKRFFKVDFTALNALPTRPTETEALSIQRMKAAWTDRDQ